MHQFNSSKNRSTFDSILDALSFTPLGAFGVVILFLLPYIPPFNQEYLLRWLIVATYMASLAIAFDFTAGFINIVNFGFAAIVGLGGYISAILCNELGISPWIGMFIGAMGAGALGLVIGIITLRLRGIFAACLAWFFGLALMGLATKMVWLTRGPMGLRTPLLFKSASNEYYYYVILTMMLLTYLITKFVVRSKIGLAFKSIGQNMDAARTSGVNPVYYRIFNFTLSCMIGGWLGGFYAHYYGILTPDLMLTSKTVEVLAVAYIGGRSSLWGGAVSAFPFVIIMEMVRSTLSGLPGLNLLLYGIFLIIIMIYYPGGFSHFINTHIRNVSNPFLNYLMNGRTPSETLRMEKGVSYENL